MQTLNEETESRIGDLKAELAADVSFWTQWKTQIDSSLRRRCSSNFFFFGSEKIAFCGIRIIVGEGDTILDKKFFRNSRVVV